MKTTYLLKLFAVLVLLFGIAQMAFADGHYWDIGFYNNSGETLYVHEITDDMWSPNDLGKDITVPYPTPTTGFQEYYYSKDNTTDDNCYGGILLGVYTSTNFTKDNLYGLILLDVEEHDFDIHNVLGDLNGTEAATGFTDDELVDILNNELTGTDGSCNIYVSKGMGWKQTPRFDNPMEVVIQLDYIPPIIPCDIYVKNDRKIAETVKWQDAQGSDQKVLGYNTSDTYITHFQLNPMWGYFNLANNTGESEKQLLPYMVDIYENGGGPVEGRDSYGTWGGYMSNGRLEMTYTISP